MIYKVYKVHEMYTQMCTALSIEFNTALYTELCNGLFNCGLNFVMNNVLNVVLNCVQFVSFKRYLNLKKC